MRIRNGALDISNHLSPRPTWGEFAAVIKELCERGEATEQFPVFVTSQQGATIAFTSQATVLGPGHILTPICTVWTEDSEEMREDGAAESHG
jgi:hypothetical protein